MEPVDHISKAMEILRRQMTENLERLKSAGKLPSQSAAKLASKSSGTSSSVRETIARKIRAIDPLTADFDNRAGNLFIESVLAAEFGHSLLNDPAFRDVVREVQQSMLSQESVRRELQSLVRGLRAS